MSRKDKQWPYADWMDLENPNFLHGQLYAACSRVGNPSNILIYTPNGLTNNIVHNTLLINIYYYNIIKIT